MDPVGGARMQTRAKSLSVLLGGSSRPFVVGTNVIHEIGPDAVLVATER